MPCRSRRPAPLVARRALLPVALLVVVCATGNAQTTGDGAGYDHARHLQHGVSLWWSVSEQSGSISLAVRAPTTGWVGVGVSPTGGMEGADIAVGWVSGGVVSMDDRYATAQQRPEVDSVQHLSDVSGWDNGTHTLLRWTRPLSGCNEQDVDIRRGTTRVIYAYGDSEPSEPALLQQHVAHGTASIVLRGERAEPTLSDAERAALTAVDITLGGAQVPARGYNGQTTSYVCSGAPLPHDVARHIVRVEALVDPANVDRLHHLRLYECDQALTSDDLAFVGSCYGVEMPHALRACNNGKVIASWSHGGGDIVFPALAGYPVAGTGGVRFALLEAHFENPDMEAFSDSSGVRLHMTTVLRSFDAGVLAVGHIGAPRTMAIPAGQETYAIEGWCPAGCTHSMFGPGGIAVFGVDFQTHEVAVGASVRHIRAGEEQPPLLHDMYFDESQRDYMFLDTERVVQAYDTLLTTCLYDTRDRETSTEAGLSLKEEECIAFLYYFPKAEVGSCMSLNVRRSGDSILGVSSCRGGEEAVCSAADTGDSATLLHDGTVPVHPAEKSFRSYEEVRCGERGPATVMEGAVRQPPCDEDLFHGSEPTPGGGESQIINSNCILDMCAPQLDICFLKANCTRELTCLAGHCGSDVATPCESCELIGGQALQGCAQRFCSTDSPCVHCGGCDGCFAESACGGRTSGPDCAACTHCQHCQTCRSNVDMHTDAHACLSMHCEEEAAACGAGCFAIAECYTDCRADADLATAALGLPGVELEDPSRRTPVECVLACSGPALRRDYDQFREFATCGGCLADLTEQHMDEVEARREGRTGVSSAAHRATRSVRYLLSAMALAALAPSVMRAVAY